MKNEYIVPTADGSIHALLINPEEMPSVITAQVHKLSELEKRVVDASDKAKTAKKAAEDAKAKSAGAFKKKQAIEALQTSGFSLSEAIVSSAQAHEIGFEFQQKLAEVTKYLFALGISNIAQNRVVVRELEQKLKGASAEQLSELVQNEILNIITQLKAQEDLLSKHERLADRVRSHDHSLHLQVEKDIEHDELLRRQMDTDQLHNQKLAQQAEKDRLHDETIDALEARCKGDITGSCG